MHQMPPCSESPHTRWGNTDMGVKTNVVTDQNWADTGDVLIIRIIGDWFEFSISGI